MTGRYKVYLENSDSNSEWLGEIPAHWIVSKFAYVKTVLTDYTANGSFADLKKNVAYKDEPSFARLVRLTDLRKDLDNDGVWIDESAYNYLKKSALFGGEFLLANVGAYAGLFYQMPYNKGPASLAPNMFMAKFSQTKILPEFMAYVGQSDPINKQLTLNATASSAQPKLNKDDFKSIKFCYPSLIEQQKIAGFLDHETAKIDTLIAKQEKLIELLKEKRQAVISHAVTKGLNPNAPMRDSGVEWLGEVPEHWSVGRYKFCNDRVIVGIAEAATHAYAEDGVPLIRSTNIKDDCELSGEFLYLKEEFAASNATKMLFENDVVTVRTGYPGVSAVVPKELNKSQCFTNLVATPNKNSEPYFLSNFLNSHLGKSYFALQGWGSAQQNISVPILENTPIALPPQQEQIELCNFIREARKKYNNLVGKAELSIRLMKERKTALISAAVTGKIDVRDFVSEQGQPQGV